MSDLERDLRNVVGSVLGYALDFDKITNDLTERILDSEILTKEQVMCANCGDKVEEQEVWCEDCTKSFCCDRCNHASSRDKADLYCPNCLEEVREEAVEEEQTLRLEEIEKALGIPKQQSEHQSNCKRWELVLKTAQKMAGQERYTGEMDLLHELALSLDTNRGLVREVGLAQKRLNAAGEELLEQDAKLSSQARALENRKVVEEQLRADLQNSLEQINKLRKDNMELWTSRVAANTELTRIKEALKGLKEVLSD